MSVSAGLNRVTWVSCLVAVAVLVTALLTRPHETTRPTAGDAPTSEQTAGGSTAASVTTPTTSLDVITATGASLPLELSRRLFEAAPTVALADAADGDALRLGATRVLTFGATQDVRGAVAMPLADQQAAEQAGRLVEPAPVPPRPADAVVVTRSAEADIAALATARAAGAHVIAIPDADPRTDPEVARYFAEHPTVPVIALGAAFADLAYPLGIVRGNVQQPSGGYLALDGKHYTAMYGHPGAPQLGVLGEQGVRKSIARVERLARKYRRISTAQFVPTFEIIATVASASAGKDKNYSTETSVAKLRPLVDAAEKAGVYVVLDLQPGRTDFLTQVKRYRSLLERPHVGLALDPEWRLTRKQKHLVQIGSVTAAEINRTSAWLADLTRDHTLPQKVFVLHQFSTSMIKHRGRVDTSRPELATVIHVDGSGPQGAKQGTWRTLRSGAPEGVGWGWKNFVDEDSPMLDARQTWRRVTPHPDLITYQ